MQIRKANVDDTCKACQIVRRSIAELCQADHQDDPIVLEQWLSNYTFKNMRSWIADSNTYVVVATEATAIIGVGAVTSSGEITLNYVSPDARFRGVSKAILYRLEARARELNNKTCTLTSTETARRFYLSAGYVQFGPPEPGIGKGSSYRMMKSLLLPAQVFDRHQS
jgi:N-acetylglutamate synthase-like GNAT family acetyltransferase